MKIMTGSFVTAGGHTHPQFITKHRRRQKSPPARHPHHQLCRLSRKQSFFLSAQSNRIITRKTPSDLNFTAVGVGATGASKILPDRLCAEPRELAWIGHVLEVGSQTAVVSTATPITTNTSDVRAIADTISITLGLGGLPALVCCVKCRFKNPTAPSNVIAPNSFR